MAAMNITARITIFICSLYSFSHQLVFWDYCLQIPSDCCKYAVPYSSSDCGVEDEFQIIHLCKTGWYGYQLSHNWYESSSQCSHYAMVIKIFLTTLNLLFVQQAAVSPFASCEGVYHGAPKVECQEIIYCSSEVGTQCCGYDKQENILVASGVGMICRRWKHNL